MDAIVQTEQIIWMMLWAANEESQPVIRSSALSNRRLEFKLSIGFVHPGGFMLGWFMGQMMEQGFRRLGCAN